MLRKTPSPLPALALALGLASEASSAPPAGVACRPAPVPGAGLHAPFDALLRAHVRDGAVAYACLAEDAPRLDAYLASLAAVDPTTLSRPGKLAFWLNAYNAWTLRLVLDHYPGLGSIKTLPDPWGRPLARLGGRTYSLDELEHGILRKQFDEPRVHFALVCASRSCPDLPAEAFDPDRLEAQLEAAARRFFADPAKGLRVAVEPGKVWGETPTLHLSSILDWYGSDFTRRGGTLLAALEPWFPPAARAFAEAHRGRLRVAFMDYDWGLNDLRSPPGQ